MLDTSAHALVLRINMQNLALVFGFRLGNLQSKKSGTRKQLDKTLLKSQEISTYQGLKDRLVARSEKMASEKMAPITTKDHIQRIKIKNLANRNILESLLEEARNVLQKQKPLKIDPKNVARKLTGERSTGGDNAGTAARLLAALRQPRL